MYMYICIYIHFKKCKINFTSVFTNLWLNVAKNLIDIKLRKLLQNSSKIKQKLYTFLKSFRVKKVKLYGIFNPCS